MAPTECSSIRNRIQLFTLDGEHISFITKDVRRPSGSYPYLDGAIIVPELYSRVTLLDRNDELLVHLGEDDAWTRDGWPGIPTSDYKPDRFVSPHAACANSKGDIFVVDWVPLGRVSKLTRL
ncbi:MAG: repeat-containing protein [Paenibacillaceae bacterium]|jgi:hypothetical protein|nr:repeat-containing protein [Paenibacillaceae bacterium]